MLKKVSKLIFVLCSIFSCALMLSGCIEIPGFPMERQIIYIVEGETYYTDTSAGNEVLVLPTNPSKTGYLFDGWYLDQDFTKVFNKNTFASKEITQDVMVYAKFVVNTNSYTIRLNAGTGATVSDTYKTVPYGQNFVLPVPTKTDYIFKGWLYNNTLITNEQGVSLSTFTYETNISVTAKWEKEPSIFTITAYINGNKYTTLQANKNQNFKLPSITKSGYIFKGWEYNEVLITDANGYSLQVYNYGCNIDVSAKFDRDPTYKRILTLNTDDTSLNKTYIEIYQGDSYTLPVPYKEGYTFKYWYYLNGASKVALTDENGECLSAYNLSSGKQIYSYFERYYVWTDTTPFLAGEVTYREKEYVTPGTTVTLIATADEGYEFEGWYASSPDSWNIVGDRLTHVTEYTFTMPENNVRYIAKFTKKWYSLTVSADTTCPGAGSVEVFDGEKEYNSLVHLNATTNSGYNFEGWYLNGELYDLEPVTTGRVHGPSNFVAKWSAYTFTFDISQLNGDVRDKTTDKTASYYNLNNNYPPTAIGDSRTFAVELDKGQTFLGWFKGETLISKDFEITLTMAQESIEYTVKSIDCPITLTTNMPEISSFIGLNDITTIGDKLTITAKGTVGYIFEGWYKNNILYSQSMTVKLELTENPVHLETRWVKCTSHKLENCFCACGFEKHSEVVFCHHEDLNSLYFGTYPQGQVKDEDLIESLNAEVGEINATTLEDWNAQSYEYLYEYNTSKSYTKVYYKDVVYMFDEKPYVSTINSYYDKQITTKYSRYNPFKLVENFAELSNQDLPVTSVENLKNFNELSLLFKDFLKAVSAQNTVLTDNSLTAFTNCFTKARQMYKTCKAPLGYNGDGFTSSKIDRGIVINLNKNYVYTLENSLDLQNVNYLNLVANLFGYSDVNEFSKVVEDMITMYTENFGKEGYSALESNCYYTEDKSFIFPVVNYANVGRVYMYLILDENGDLFAFFDNIEEALDIVNYDQELYPNGTTNQILCKDVLFENGYYEYRALYFKDYKPTLYTYNKTSEYSNQDDNGYTAGTVYWFKYEPIKWKVMSTDEGQLMLWSDIILDSQPYGDTYYKSSNVYYDESTFKNGKKVQTSAWHESVMRGYLNGRFYSDAFNSNSKLTDLISVMLTKDYNQINGLFDFLTKDYTYSNGSDYNPRSVTVKAKYGNNNREAISQKIYDGAIEEYTRIFLPNQYSMNSLKQEERIKGYSDYALAQGLYVDPETKNARLYLLQTGVDDSTSSSMGGSYVDTDGSIRRYGEKVSGKYILPAPIHLDVGVAPMLVFNLPKATK